MSVTLIPKIYSSVLSGHTNCARSNKQTKSLSEVQVIQSLGRKLNVAFLQNYDRSGDYELQFDLSRDAGFDYAPRQLFASKIKPLT
jgi:hypothetical protein